jgi:hypothetical protein
MNHITLWALSMIYSWANWWGLLWGGANGPSKWCTAPLMTIILTPSAGDWMLTPKEAICKWELYFQICLWKDTVAGGRHAPGAGSELSMSRNGWGGGMGKTASQLQDLPLVQQRFACPREASSGHIIARHCWHSAVLPPMSSTRTLASSNFERGTQAVVQTLLTPRLPL